MGEEQLQLLEGLILVDPSRRLAASAALSSPYLRDASASRPPRSSSPVWGGASPAGNTWPHATISPSESAASLGPASIWEEQATGVASFGGSAEARPQTPEWGQSGQPFKADAHATRQSLSLASRLASQQTASFGAATFTGEGACSAAACTGQELSQSLGD